MKIAVTRLTRMERGYICVAAVDVDRGVHVRPLLPMRRLSVETCARHGGPFDMATVVDLGRTRPVPARPQIEDHELTPSSARRTKLIEPKLFWEMLCYLARPTLSELFGPDLRVVGRGRALVPVGVGRASLGCLTPRGQPMPVTEPDPGGTLKLRRRFSDGAATFNLSVTDPRLVHDDHRTPIQERVEDIQRRLTRGVRCLLSLGLTRPFAASGSQPPTHWLQVYNLHLEDDPCWRFGPATAPSLLPPPAPRSHRLGPWRMPDDDLENLRSQRLDRRATFCNAWRYTRIDDALCPSSSLEPAQRRAHRPSPCHRY